MTLSGSKLAALDRRINALNERLEVMRQQGNQHRREMKMLRARGEMVQARYMFFGNLGSMIMFVVYPTVMSISALTVPDWVIMVYWWVIAFIEYIYVRDIPSRWRAWREAKINYCAAVSDVLAEKD